MSTNQEGTSRDDGTPTAIADNGSMSPPADDNAGSAEAVIEAYSAAARRVAGGGEGAFAAAVRAYRNRHPQMEVEDAAKAVADIICHRS